MCYQNGYWALNTFLKIDQPLIIFMQLHTKAIVLFFISAFSLYIEMLCKTKKGLLYLVV